VADPENCKGDMLMGRNAEGADNQSQKALRRVAGSVGNGGISPSAAD